MNSADISRRRKEKDVNVGRKIRISTYLLMFSYALSATMISPLMPEILKEFSLKLSQGGLILTLQSIGGILVVALAGIFADKISKSRLIIFGFSLYIICLYLISISPLFSIVLILSFFFGFGSRLVDNLSNAYISDLFPDQKGRYLNILHSSFGLGALFGPIYTRFMLDMGYSWEYVFSFLAYGSIPLLIFYYLSQRGKADSVNHNDNTTERVHLTVLLKNKQIWVLAIIMFFYVGHQSAVILWTPMYIETYLKGSAFIASLSLSIYWIGMIISRLTFSHITRNHKKSIVIRWTALIGGVILLLGLLTRNTWFVIAFLTVSGLLTGAFIPMLIDIAGTRFPANTGAVTSILYLTLNCSVMVFPWMIGLIAENISFQWGMIIAALSLSLIFFISFVYRDD